MCNEVWIKDKIYKIGFFILSSGIMRGWVDLASALNFSLWQLNR